ncbi:MAG TPA: hypothetical protein VLC72_03625 [Nitrosopumilaceae archaeon]|nr:hypothetical protein [Nitrosopumilaceae archaeon]
MFHPSNTIQRVKKQDHQINNVANHTNMKRDLITVAVEYALLQMGTPELEKVETRLANDYNCKIGDCLEHPEYLKSILCDLFGNSYQDILDSIEQVIKDANIDNQVEEFVMVLRSK